MLFWRVAKKILHGKGIALLQGITNSVINFAIPANIKPIQDTDIPDTLEPGIITPALEIKSKSTASMVLSVDGKKVAPSLNDTCGDVDLFGYEKPSLKEVQAHLKEELKLLENLKSIISDENKQGEVISKISHALTNISERIKALRKAKLSQTFHLEKLIKESARNPDNKDKVYAISKVS